MSTFIIISCSGNYSGNEDEVLNSVTCLNKYKNIFCTVNTLLDDSEKNCSQTGLGSSSNLWMATDKCTLNEPKFYCSDQGLISIKNYPNINDTVYASSCTGTGLIETIEDNCIDDGGTSGADDTLEIYCKKNIPRFCLSKENCDWR